MVRRPLGTTGLSLSSIGFGSFKIGRNTGTKYAAGYDLPDTSSVDALLDGVLALGINYVDTAPAYGLAEERLGTSLRGRRDQVVISTKVGEEFEAGVSRYDFARAAVDASLERSLRRLATDAIDLVFVHAPRDDLAILDHTDVVETLVDAKRRGLTRLIGWSGKSVESARRALDWADALMVELHAEDTSHDELVAEAGRRGVGVVVKKGLASGRLPPDRAIPFVLDHPGVTSLVVGTLDLAHLRDDVRIAASAG